MKRQDFDFELPPELIAQYPLARRSDARLLMYNCKTSEHQHHQFKALADLLDPGDLLVMNDSRVIPARMYGHKASGGKVEVFVERVIDETRFSALIRASKAPKIGSVIDLNDQWWLEIINKEGDFYQCQSNGNIEDILKEIGHIPRLGRCPP